MLDKIGIAGLGRLLPHLSATATEQTEDFFIVLIAALLEVKSSNLLIRKLRRSGHCKAESAEKEKEK